MKDCRNCGSRPCKCGVSVKENASIEGSGTAIYLGGELIAIVFPERFDSIIEDAIREYHEGGGE